MPGRKARGRRLGRGGQREEVCRRGELEERRGRGEREMGTHTWTAAPNATASSGFTPLFNSLPLKYSDRSVCTRGMRVEPPTNTICEGETQTYTHAHTRGTYTHTEHTHTHGRDSEQTRKRTQSHECKSSASSTQENTTYPTYEYIAT